MTRNTAKHEEKKKKPYVKPELDSAIVYEASGATCCKLTTVACLTSSKASLGKGLRPAAAS